MGSQRLRSRLAYRKRPSGKPVIVNMAVRHLESQAREARSAAEAEPASDARGQLALDAYEVYEAACRERGICRAFECFRTTTLRYCKNHR